MSFKQRLFAVLVLFLCLCVLLLGIAHKNRHAIKRDPKVLMNTYFRLKQKNPTAAKQALDIILKQNENYAPALIELSQWLVHQKAYTKAIEVLEKLQRILPPEKMNPYRFQLAHLYYKTGQWEKAKATYAQIKEENITLAASKAMASFVPNYKDFSQAKWFSTAPKESALNTYYRMRKTPGAPYAAYLKKISEQLPDSVQILIELGTLAIQENRLQDAIHAFQRVYALKQDQTTALQLGYLYSSVGQNKTAYRHFKMAAQDDSSELSLIAQDAMTRLAGQQTQSFPEPYYGEFFMMPFTQSRFGITVSQFIGRLGVEFKHLETQPRVYSFTRRTEDNRQNNFGELTQLYEDNVWVTGIGAQLFPFRTLPLFLYVEGGAARDLYYIARERWRPDLRAGFMYYQEIGKMPSYYGKLTYSADYYAIWYAEMTYFSRYNNNVIGSIRTHQGIRFLQYKDSMLSLFIRGRVIEDTNRDFYNNFAELGPGISIVPSNRFNLEIHLDYINGMYLPAGGIQKNPYSKYYSNRRALLLFYIKL